MCNIYTNICINMGLPGDTSGKEPAWEYRRCKRCGFDLWVGKIPWRRAWQPTPVFLPGKSHGQRNLAGYNPQGHRELDKIKTAQHACMHVYICIYVHMCMHVCIYLYKYKCTCVYKFMYIRAHIIKSATYIKIFVCCRSVAKSSLTLCYPMDCSLPVHARLLCPLPSPRVCSNSCPLSR